MDRDNRYETTYYNPEEVRRQSERQGQQRPRKKRRKNRGLRVLVYLVMVLLVSAMLAGFGWLLANDLCAFNKTYKESTITVAEDDSVSDVAVKLKKAGLIPLFVLLFFCYMAMGYLSSKDFAQASMNWISEGVNILGSCVLLTGTLLLHRFGLEKLQLEKKIAA